jgi:ankyrin repeat protein
MIERLRSLFFFWMLALVGTVASAQESGSALAVSRLIRVGDITGIRNALEAEPALVRDQNNRPKWTLLHDAVLNGRTNALEICSLLIEKGVNVNAQDSEGNTALHFATYRTFGREKLAPETYEGIIVLLLKSGAVAGARNAGGVTPLHLAVLRNGDVIALQLLLAAGADVNAKAAASNGGWTPLHGAAALGRVAVEQFLLKNGADRNAKDAGGMTPLEAAEKAGKVEAAQLLR